MKIVVSGATGFIGTALALVLQKEGHEVVRLTRGAPGPGALHWDPARGEIDRAGLAGTNAVVHLAGEGIAARRWNAQHKARVLDSRVRGTYLLAETIAGLDPPPEVLVSASAVGFYGDRGDEKLTEDSPAGSEFLPRVCRAWEASTQPAEAAGIRVVHIRSGIVLSRRGGALPPILLPFRLGFGGRLGSGRQWWPWISLEDEVRAVIWCLEQETLRGPVNLVAPAPVRQAEFAAAVGRVLHRPTFFPTPAVALKAVLGPEMAHQILLLSQRVLPARLEASGFSFMHPVLDHGLRSALGGE